MYSSPSDRPRPSAGQPPPGTSRPTAQRTAASRSYSRPPDDTVQLRRVDAELADYLDSLNPGDGGPPHTPPRRPEPPGAEPEPEPETRARTDASLARVVAAIASLAAGAIHVAATPPHWDEWRTAGLFFAGSAAFQLLWGLAALKFGNAFIRVVALLANLGLLGVWALSRLQGLPFGPSAGVPEAVGTEDLLAAALEIVVVAGLALSLLPREREGSVSAAGYGAAVVVAFVVFGAAGAQGSVSALEHGHSHDHGSETGGDGHGHDHGDEEADPSESPSEAADEESPADESLAEEEDHTHAPGEEHD